MRITVLTPTYNRGGSIQKLYTSLDNQSIKDFEWLIVDDGSLDDTAQVVRKVQNQLILESAISIRKTAGSIRH